MTFAFLALAFGGLSLLPHTAYSIFVVISQCTRVPFSIGTGLIFSCSSLYVISSSRDVPLSTSTCGSAVSCSRICSNPSSFMKSFTVGLCLCLSCYLSIWCLRVGIMFDIYNYASPVDHKAKVDKGLLQR